MIYIALQISFQHSKEPELLSANPANMYFHLLFRNEQYNV